MSIVATVKVYDGIALGAESMTQLTAVINYGRGCMRWTDQTGRHQAGGRFRLGDAPEALH